MRFALAAKYAAYSRLERRQFLDDSAPNNLDINPVVLMPKPISCATNFAPRWARTINHGVFPEPDCSFTNHQKLAFNSRHCLRIFAESS